MRIAVWDRASSPKLTRNQREILACLRSANEPLGAYAILDRVKAAGIMYAPSVYRALNDLMRLGMVHRIELLSAFVACQHAPCDYRTAFVICSGCQKVVEVPIRSDQQAVLQSLSSQEMGIERLITLEFSGLCRSCRSIQARPRREYRTAPVFGGS